MQSKSARLLLCLFLAGAMLEGQSVNNQEISGQVQDATGSAVPKAAIRVVNTDTGFARTALSNETGNFVVANLPIGHYSVSAEAAGFKKAVLSDIQLTTNQKLAVNLKLEVGNLSDSITVQAEAAQVETTTGEVRRVVTGEQATQLQLNGRNFPQLLALLPGVSTTYASGFSLFGGYGVNNSGQSANGARTDTFSWNLDGADNKDNGGGGNNFVNINPDALSEFAILTTNYGAQYGYSSGAVVNLSIKSGTRDFHGAAYEYLRNDKIQGRAFNALTKPPLRFNNFGWNLGGPIYIPGHFNRDRDKLFFFIGGDFKRLRQGVTTTWNVPTAAIRGGDFSALPPASRPLDPSTGVPFASGMIPANRINPNGQRLLLDYPAPNAAGASGNYVFNYVSPLNSNQYIYKVDYNASSRHQFNWHYVRDYYTSTQNFTQLILYDRNIPGTNTAAQWTFVPNPTTVNVAQFAFTGNVISQRTGIRPNPVFLNDYTRAGLGFTGASLFNASGAIPSITVSGYNDLTSTPLNWNNFNRIFSWKDDLSKTLGNHTLKAGVLVMRSRKNQDNVPAINGTFGFSTSRAGTSGNAAADALLGNFYSYTEASGTRQGWYRFTQVEPYIQDDWKLSSRLTLNAGLRWAYIQPQYSALNNTTAFLPEFFDRSQAAVVDPKTGYILSQPNPYNGLALGGDGFPDTAKGRVLQADDPAVKALFRGIPKGTAKTDWNTWAPRLGFAYDLTGRQSTVLRGGYGVFYERVQGNFIFSAVNNPPFVQQTTIFNGSVDNPAGGVAGPKLAQNINNSHFQDMKVPRTMNWSLGVQQKLSSTATLDVTYVGSSASNLTWQQDINQLPVGTLTANPGVNVNALRPYPGYADIFEFNTGANFIYNSLQVQARKQFSQGGLVNLAYTWSKGRTDAPTYNYQPMNNYDLRRDWGPSNYNRNHIFVFSYVYPLPFWRTGSNWYQKALGGWQLSGVTTLQTGRPLNVTLAGDLAGIGTLNQRPNLVGDPRAGVSGAQFLNRQAFAVPAPGTLGNLGSYAVYGPGTNNWDASLQKDFPIHERARLGFRAEFYNFPNHLSFFDVNVGSFAATPPANFGSVSQATDPRTLQFALRMMF